MRITFDHSRRRVAVLTSDEVRLLDVSGDEPVTIATRPAPDAHSVSASDAGPVVLRGAIVKHRYWAEEGVADRYDGDLTELGSLPAPKVCRGEARLSADGGTLGLIDLRTISAVDPATGQVRASVEYDDLELGSPSGLAVSPDGRHLIAGFTDQGEGTIALLTVEEDDDELTVDELPASEPSPGLDDAPFVSTFSPSGALVAVANHSWGGRGLFVFDVAGRKPLWSRTFEVLSPWEEAGLDPDTLSEEEFDALGPDLGDSENWIAFPVAFTADGSVVLAAHPKGVRAFRATDGEELGDLEIAVDFRYDWDGVSHRNWIVAADTPDLTAGFAVDDASRRIWTSSGDGTVTAHPFPEAWPT